MTTYKTIYEAHVSSTRRPVFESIEDARAFMEFFDCVPANISAFNGHPDNLESEYWVSLDNDNLPDRYTQADLENCVGDGSDCPCINPLAVPVDFEPLGRAEYQPEIPEMQ